MNVDTKDNLPYHNQMNTEMLSLALQNLTKSKGSVIGSKPKTCISAEGNHNAVLELNFTAKLENEAEKVKCNKLKLPTNEEHSFPSSHSTLLKKAPPV